MGMCALYLWTVSANELVCCVIRGVFSRIAEFTIEIEQREYKAN